MLPILALINSWQKAYHDCLGEKNNHIFKNKCEFYDLMLKNNKIM